MYFRDLKFDWVIWFLIQKIKKIFFKTLILFIFNISRFNFYNSLFFLLLFCYSSTFNIFTTILFYVYLCQYTHQSILTNHQLNVRCRRKKKLLKFDVWFVCSNSLICIYLSFVIVLKYLHLQYKIEKVFSDFICLNIVHIYYWRIYYTP